MQFVFYLYSIIILYVVFSINHDAFHPAVVTIVSWLAVVISYNFVIYITKIWIPLSDNLYIYLMFYIAAFVGGEYLFHRKRYQVEYREINFGFKYETLLNTSIIAVALTDKYFIDLIRSVGYFALRDNLNSLPIYAKVGTYASPLLLVLIVFGFLSQPKKNLKYKLILGAILYLISVFSMGSKSGFFQIFFCVLFILHDKGQLTKKNLLRISIALLLIVLIIQTLRISNSDKSSENSNTKDFFLQFIYIYFLSPLPAFDLLVTGKLNLSTNSFGGASLGFLYRVLGKVFSLPLPKGPDGWVSVPYITNVYTLLGNYYIDFGVLGVIVVGFIYGAIFGALYINAERRENVFSKCFYAIYLSCLAMQFFGDWFFGFASATIQTAFWLFIIKNKFKVYGLKYEGN